MLRWVAMPSITPFRTSCSSRVALLNAATTAAISAALGALVSF
nr:MAG TPA_asm: hypothetical protein [Caudoviricetes sp.]